MGTGEAKKNGSMNSQSFSVSGTVPKNGLRNGAYTTSRTSQLQGPIAGHDDGAGQTRPLGERGYPLLSTITDLDRSLTFFGHVRWGGRGQRHPQTWTGPRCPSRSG